MKTVVVNKKELIEKITQNKSEHVVDFNEANAAFKENYIKECNKMIERAEDGDFIFRFSVMQPQSHEEDYDTILTMLNMSLDDQIELEEHDFQRYVQDNWEWKDNFNHVYLANTQIR